jgi:aspartate carbamoyltransferase regulatory subunit
MYYIRVSEDNANQLIYYCRNCGHEDTLLTSENVCVLKTQLTQSEKNYTHIVNKYTKLDPTLPRINSIRCPNQNCKSNKEEGVEREVIYLRYDDTNMKYIYICALCDTVWNTDELK